MVRILMSPRWLPVDEVRDFCDRRLGFLEGLEGPVWLVVIDRRAVDGGSTPWEWRVVTQRGDVRVQHRDGGPHSRIVQVVAS